MREKMKGQTSELLEILILVGGSLILILISYFLFTNTSSQTTSLTVEENQFERITNSVTEFFYVRYPLIEKNLAQMLADSIDSGQPVVFYGERYGSLDVEKIITEHFNSIFGDRWHLETVHKSKKVDYGFNIPQNVRIRTFIIKLPMPGMGGDVLDVKLSQW